MPGAIIHFEPIFSRLDQGFFFQRTLKKIKRERPDFLLYLLPINQERPSKKALYEFISYLKNEKIERILFTEAMKKRPEAEILLKHFQTYEGNTIINETIHEILKNCSQKKHLCLQDCTLVFYTNYTETLKELVFKLYPFVKTISIQTEHEALFLDLTSHFLENYGIYISVNQKFPKENIKLFLDGEQRNSDFSFQTSEILFSQSVIPDEIRTLLKPNQYFLEYMIEKQQKKLKNEQIHQFFIENQLNIVKIENND